MQEAKQGLGRRVWINIRSPEICRFPPHTWQVDEYPTCVLVGEERMFFFLRKLSQGGSVYVGTPDKEEGSAEVPGGNQRHEVNREVPGLFSTSSRRKPAASLYLALGKLEDPSLENINQPHECTIWARIALKWSQPCVSLISVTGPYSFTWMNTKDGQSFEDSLQHKSKQAKQIMQIEKWTQRKQSTRSRR